MQNEKILKEIGDIPFLKKLTKAFPDSELFLVGGTIRDLFCGKTNYYDLDLVMTKTPIAKIIECLEGYGSVSLVGKAFWCFKILF